MGGAGSHRLSSLWWVMDFEFVFGLIVGVGINLKDAFPALYCIAQNKEAFVANYMSWNDGVLYWDILFTRFFNDWEFKIF